MYAAIPRVTGADDRLAARLQGYDPFFDDLSRALVVEDAQEIRELMLVAAAEREVVFTFPSMPEIFSGSLMARPGSRNSGPPLVLVDVSAAELDTTTWARGIAVNLGFFDGPEFIGFRTSFAGSARQIMALVGPRLLHRLPPPGRERAALPPHTRIAASLTLPGEPGRIGGTVLEAGETSLRLTLCPGPLHRTGLPVSLSLQLETAGRPAKGLNLRATLARMWLREDQSRDALLDLELVNTNAQALRPFLAGDLPAVERPMAVPGSPL